jgi:argininosuccinate lyase
MLTTMKGLPLAYNRDLQEDKESLFGAHDTLTGSLEVFTGMVATLQFKPQGMQHSLEQGYILATDIADYLVKKGLSFREAHGITGRLVSYAVDSKKALAELTLEEYQRFSPLFDEDVYAINIAGSVASKNVPGGTAPGRVAYQIDRCRKILDGED